MDGEHEKMQFLGLCGICRDSFNVISSRRKLFAQIALALIFPSVIIGLCNEKLSDSLKANRDELLYHKTQGGESLWMNHKRAETPLKIYIARAVAAGWKYSAFNVVDYITVYVILRSLYTAAVAYATACVYAKIEVSFKTVMKVVPKVWKKALVPNVYSNLLISLWIFALLIIDEGLYVFLGDSFIRILVTACLLITYYVGLPVLVIIFNFAYVVSALGDECELKAIIKSKNLLKGKALVAGGIFIIKILLSRVIFRMVDLAMYGNSPTAYRVSLGVVGIPLMTMAPLLGVVQETILYIVCMSCHHQEIDKCALSHLAVDYAPLKPKDDRFEAHDD